MKRFSYTTLKSHVWTDKHIKRLDDDIAASHPRRSNNNNNNNQQPLVAPTKSPTTEFDQIINAIKLVHVQCKTGMTETLVTVLSNFIHRNCKKGIANHMSTDYRINQILESMNEYQLKRDDNALLGEHRNGNISLAMDGSTHRKRDMKIFFGKAWQKGVGPVTRYVEGENPQKNIIDVDVNLEDLLTMDTGKDNVRIIEKVVVNRLKIQWHQLLQLAVDGASNNIGTVKGCATTVRFMRFCQKTV